MTSNYPCSSPLGFSLPPCPLSPTPEEVYGNTIPSTYADGHVIKVYVEADHIYSIALAGRCINIHRSFLPSFKGAKPYHQSHERGVKIIGATAHYLTTDLDESPISEQDVQRVHHEHVPKSLV